MPAEPKKKKEIEVGNVFEWVFGNPSIRLRIPSNFGTIFWVFVTQTWSSKDFKLGLSLAGCGTHTHQVLQLDWSERSVYVVSYAHTG